MLIPVILFGQNEPNTKIDLPKKNIYAEAHLGIITQIAINYEKQLKLGKKVSWYGRVGAGYGGNILFTGAEGWGGLGAITMLTGKKNNHFELNAGGFFTEEGIDLPVLILNFGYRFQKPEGGFIF